MTVSNHEVLGQSWEQGLVSLSWESTKHRAANMHDGRNVVIHEFAHQLDQEDGIANGLPVLRSRCRYAAWKSVLSEEYERLQDRVEKGRKTERQRDCAQDLRVWIFIIADDVGGGHHQEVIRLQMAQHYHDAFK